MDSGNSFDLGQLIPILVGTGGVGTFITWYYDHRTKKREESISMAKFKMKKIDGKYNDYWDLISYSAQLSAYLNKLSDTPSKFDKEVIFISILKLLQIINKINNNGSFLLASQEAETVISELAIYVQRKMRMVYPQYEFLTFRSLDSTIPFEEIGKKIDDNSTDYHKYFEELFKWILKPENSDETFKIKMTSKCLSELLIFELNVIYEVWYNRKFEASEFLSQESKEYLVRTHNFGDEPNHPILLNSFSPTYFTRIY